MSLPIISSRLNSMKVRSDLWDGERTVAGLIQRMGTVAGIDGIDLNYPEHVDAESAPRLRHIVQDNGLRAMAVNLRFSDEFRGGAFTSPDAATRGRAVDFTLRAAEVAAVLGCAELVLWPAFDGYDYPFQLDYAAAWKSTVEALGTVADSLSTFRIGIEYKPSEPRRFSLLANGGMALAAIEQTGRTNLGLTVDFAHALMAGENPACVARIAAASGRLVGVHLNDAYGRADDGLAVGTIHERQTVELLWHLQQAGYGGHLYFDTFPTDNDPAREAAHNVAAVHRLWRVASELDASLVAEAMALHDANRAIGVLGYPSNGRESHARIA